MSSSTVVETSLRSNGIFKQLKIFKGDVRKKFHTNERTGGGEKIKISQ